MKTRKICLHCCRRTAGRPRGLCHGCYYADGVRDLYPIHPSMQGFFVANSRPVGSQAIPEPTTAAPGSEAKILVLQERVSQGQNLWHPLDNPVREAEAKREGGHNNEWGEEEDEDDEAF